MTTRTEAMPVSDVPAVSGIGSVFRWVAIGEACSWAALLVGMFFKYVVVENEIGVQVFGPIHGALFVAYVAVTVVAAVRLRWGFWTLALALISSIPPFMTIWFERRATRLGRLAA